MIALLSRDLYQQRLNQLHEEQINLQALCSEKNKSDQSNRTVKFIKTVLHQALDQALKWGMVGKNYSRCR